MPPFVPRQRKHKVRERLSRNEKNAGSNAHSIATETVFSNETAKDTKSNAIKSALNIQQQKTSSKKKKRLEKYIVMSIFCGVRRITTS